MPDDSNRVGLTELAQVLDLPVEEIEDYTVEPCMVNGVMRLRFVVWLRGNTDTCPQCGSLALIRNGYLTRHLNHHICFGRDWEITTKRRRMRCKVCGKSFSDPDILSYRSRNMTMEVVTDVLEALRSPSETFSNVVRKFKLSVPTVISLFDAHVCLTRLALTSHICIDENYAIKTDRSKYVLTITDFVTGIPLDILPNRHKEDLIEYFIRIPREEREKVEAVGIDMYPVYRDIARDFLPNARIVVDRFHLVKQYGDQTDAIRLKIYKHAQSELGKVKYELDKLQKLPDAQSQIHSAEIGKLKAKRTSLNRTVYLIRKFSWVLSKDPDDKIFDPTSEKKYNKAIGYRVNMAQLREMFLDTDPVFWTIVEYRKKLSHLYTFTTPEDGRLYFEELVHEMLQENVPPQIRNFA